MAVGPERQLRRESGARKFSFAAQAKAGALRCPFRRRRGENQKNTRNELNDFGGMDVRSACRTCEKAENRVRQKRTNVNRRSAHFTEARGQARAAVVPLTSGAE